MNNLDMQDNLIERFFRTTTELYDYLEWDGKELLVFLENEIIEKYSYEDLKEMIKYF